RLPLGKAGVDGGSPTGEVTFQAGAVATPIRIDGDADVRRPVEPLGARVDHAYCRAAHLAGIEDGGGIADLGRVDGHDSGPLGRRALPAVRATSRHTDTGTWRRDSASDGRACGHDYARPGALITHGTTAAPARHRLVGQGPRGSPGRGSEQRRRRFGRRLTNAAV